jgi:hypothetical protein
VVDGTVRPWTTGPITIGLQAGPYAGLSFDGTVTSGGYTAGVWDPAIEGSMTGSLVDDAGSVLSGGQLTLEVLPGSRLDFDEDEAHLFVDGSLIFDAGVSGTYGGLNIGQSELGFDIVVDAQLTHQTPFVEVTNFDVVVGELSIDEIKVDIANLATLTLEDIRVDPNVLTDPNPLGSELIGHIRKITVDLTNTPAFSELTVGQAEVFDAVLYRDRIELNDVRVSMDGLVTDGDASDPLNVLLVDDLKILFDDVTIFGSFDPSDLGQTVNVDATLSGITLDLDAGILMPDRGASLSDVVDPCTSDPTGVAGLAAVCDVHGTYDGVTGELVLNAARVAARPVPGVELDVRDMTLAVQSQTRPFAAAELASLTLALIDDQSRVTLDVDDVIVGQNGELSILQANLDAEGGVLTSLGFGGILPLDVTKLRIAAADETGPGGIPDGIPDSRTVLNRDADRNGLPDAEFEVQLSGAFDFSSLEAIGVDLDVSVGGTPRPQGNQFDTTFRVVNGTVRPWTTGPITIGLEAGPYSGLTFDGTFTTAGYSAGVWDPAIEGTMTGTLVDDSGSVLGGGDITLEVLPGSRLDFDDDGAQLFIAGSIGVNGNVTGFFGGLNIQDAELGFDVFLDTRFSEQKPFVELTRFEVVVGELSIDEITVDIPNLATLTLKDILVDPKATGDDAIAHVGRITVDATNNPALSQLTVGEVEVIDAVLYRDRIELNDITVSLNGVVTDGDADDPLSLLLVDDLEMLFDDVTIFDTSRRTPPS